MEPKQLLGTILEDIKSHKVELLKIPIIKEKIDLKPKITWKGKSGLCFLMGYFVFHYLFDLRFLTKKCLITMPDELSKAFRPPIDCGFCRNVNNFDVVSNILPSEFESRYAYSGRPVKIADGARNWTATDVFGYNFFKSIYDDFMWKSNKFDCQFFPYKSGFIDIFDAFNMTDDRVNQKSGNKPWYFGWSNCNYEISQILRKHYSRPYFLPATSENNAIDWIFIGVPGKGAHLHVDNVRLPSWQAQLKGRKEWYLAPPPECYYECGFFKTTVEPGEIIVLDTNKWFHQTNVLPGEVSVTIGAEYD